MRGTLWFFAILVVFVELPSQAAAATLVDGLQMPAWVERGRERLPLQADMELRESDIIETGKAGRLQILFPDGTVLKLGAESRLSIDRLSLPSRSDGVFRGFFNLTKGSFHLTAKTTARALEREITVRMNSTILHVQQADICGQSSRDADLVCLIAGAIRVDHPAMDSFVMDQPRAVFVAPKAGKPMPVAPADPEMFAAWLAATDRVAGQGTTIAEGGWVVQLAAVEDEQTARAIAQRLRQAGYPVDLTTTELNGRTFYRLRVERFDSQLEARGFAGRIKGQFGITEPWVTQLTARGAGS